MVIRKTTHNLTIHSQVKEEKSKNASGLGLQWCKVSRCMRGKEKNTHRNLSGSAISSTFLMSEKIKIIHKNIGKG